jgi:hypothetical protein
MSKKDKKNRDRPNLSGAEGGTGAISPAKAPSISKRGWKIIFAGIGVLVVGFFILSLADSSGQNWASTVSPLTIITGYVLIGCGIIASDPS